MDFPLINHMVPPPSSSRHKYGASPISSGHNCSSLAQCLTSGRTVGVVVRSTFLSVQYSDFVQLSTSTWMSPIRCRGSFCEKYLSLTCKWMQIIVKSNTCLRYQVNNWLSLVYQAVCRSTCFRFVDKPAIKYSMLRQYRKTGRTLRSSARDDLRVPRAKLRT